MQVMSIIGGDGTWYILSRQTRFNILTRQQISNVYDTEIEALVPRYRQLVQEGEMTLGAAWREHTHEAWQSIARRLGLWYDRVEV